jgi:hypothetical protein
MGGCRSFSPPPFYVSTRRHICVRSIPPFFVYLSRFLFEVIRRTSKISLRICNLANIVSFVIRPYPGSILAVEKNIDNNHHLLFLVRGIWVDGAYSSHALYQKQSLLEARCGPTGVKALHRYKYVMSTSSRIVDYIERIYQV